MRLEQAAAGYYFTKDGLLQHLIGQVKYKRHRDLGIYLGKLIGHQLKKSNRFTDVELLVPLPLNDRKEAKRGYNQATLICEGIAQVWQKTIVSDAVARTVFTQSQTNKTRIARWQNMEGVFAIANADRKSVV